MLLTILNMDYGAIAFGSIIILLILGVSNYGKDTALGYRGSLLLTLLSTPVVAFIIISFLKIRSREQRRTVKHFDR
jgi:hypothetical protein